MVHADCFHWLRKMPENSIDAVVTDPPYGVREYEARELEPAVRQDGYPPLMAIRGRRCPVSQHWITRSARQYAISSMNGQPSCCPS